MVGVRYIGPTNNAGEAVSHYSDKRRSSIEWVVALTADDMILINNALNEILNGPGASHERDPHLRTGADREHVQDLMKRIGERLKEIESRKK